MAYIKLLALKMFMNFMVQFLETTAWNVVLYEEGLDNNVITGAVRAISQADTSIIGGTYLVVYPATGLIDYFRGKHLVLINKSTTSADNKANLLIDDDIANVLKKAVDNLI